MTDERFFSSPSDALLPYTVLQRLKWSFNLIYFFGKSLTERPHIQQEFLGERDSVRRGFFLVHLSGLFRRQRLFLACQRQSHSTESPVSINHLKVKVQVQRLARILVCSDTTINKYACSFGVRNKGVKVSRSFCFINGSGAGGSLCRCFFSARGAWWWLATCTKSWTVRLYVKPSFLSILFSL